MSNDTDSGKLARLSLKRFLMILAAVIFLPLVFQNQFRKLFALILLGFAYSSFLISSWKRWMRNANRLNQNLLGGLLPLRYLRYILKFLPLKAWGVVPCVIQLLVVGLFFVCGWFLGPVIYKILRNPATPGIVREALRTGAPEFFGFLNSIAGNQDPNLLLREHAQQIFTNVNRFISVFVLPLMFIAFTSLGASLYSALENLFMKAEARTDSQYSKILNNYSQLFWEYIVFNLWYYLLLSLLVGSGLTFLDSFGFTSFGWKLIAGILVTFIAGNLLIPGIGTFAMTLLIVGMVYNESGWFLAGVLLIVFGFYFLLDDYLIKPMFLDWMGRSPSKNWEFGAETIIFGLVILYAAFGFIGVLMLFPSLCFLSAYLEDQFPEWRPWILRPIQHLRS